MPANILSEIQFNNRMNEHNFDIMKQFNAEFSRNCKLEDSKNEMNTEENYIQHRFMDSQLQKPRGHNMTECVPVPTSEHVAEIVGRQGCKIKALRAKTNTYIKTPVRGEEPVFVVTGRKEDVAAAKKEIMSAAEHFSQIRASRKNNNVVVGSTDSSSGTESPTPNQVTIYVRVPYRVVGLVVGPKGATIKRIQQQTHTYIVTPSREKEPIFEVTGMYENVENARKEIESHIAARTGNDTPDSVPIINDDINANIADCFFQCPCSQNPGSVPCYNNEMPEQHFAPNLTQQTPLIAFTDRKDDIRNNIGLQLSYPPTSFQYPQNCMENRAAKIADYADKFSSTNCFYNKDEGFESPTSSLIPPNIFSSGLPQEPKSLLLDFSDFESSASRVRMNSVNGPLITPRLSPTLVDNEALYSRPHDALRRLRSDPINCTTNSSNSAFYPFINAPWLSQEPPYLAGNDGTISSLDSLSRSPSLPHSPVESSSCPADRVPSPKRRNCIICSESEVVAALVPCGHNYFCMECANLIVARSAHGQCPLCKNDVTQVIRIS